MDGTRVISQHKNIRKIFANEKKLSAILKYAARQWIKHYYLKYHHLSHFHAHTYTAFDYFQRVWTENEKKAFNNLHVCRERMTTVFAYIFIIFFTVLPTAHSSLLFLPIVESNAVSSFFFYYFSSIFGAEKIYTS